MASSPPSGPPRLRPPLGIVGGSAFLAGMERAEAIPGGRDEAIPGGSDDAVPGGRDDAGGRALREVTTPRGTVRVHNLGGAIFLRRHGEDGYRPPHRIPHHAHVLALESLGVEQVVGLASTGSLDPEIRPGDVVIPDDYLSRHAPPTFAGDEYLHIVPELDPGLRRLLGQAAREALAGREGRLVEAGVYAETRGPRFETRAEIRSLARDATVVGMTAASEATLFQERGLPYAVLCIVDNWAHGLGPEPLSLDAFQARQAENAALAARILQALLHRLHPTPDA